MNTSKIALYTYDDTDRKLTPADTISEMYDYTDESGVLYIPEWDYMYGSDGVYKLIMDWTKTDRDAIIAEHAALTEGLTRLAGYLDAIQSEEDVTLLPEYLKSLWNTYIRGFETGDIDLDRISDIRDMLDTMDCVKSLSARIESGEEVSDEDRFFYNDYREIDLSEDDEVYYEQYCDLVQADAERRIGCSEVASDVILRAKRFCRLVNLGAPEIIINNESCYLAQAMAVHKCCKSLEVLSAEHFASL